MNPACELSVPGLPLQNNTGSDPTEGLSALGIVAEYNPFHNGHLFQLEEAKRLSGDKTLIAVMSGDFVQRGEPALLNKHARAEMACVCGVDLVLELPLYACLSSAESFASTGVRLLSAAGAEYISFGAENPSVDELSALAELLLLQETKEGIAALMKGEPSLSYASARSKYLSGIKPLYGELLLQPNNILAVEYIKAIKKYGYNAVPLPVERRGATHDAPLAPSDKGTVISASALRNMIINGESPKQYMPEPALQVLERELAAGTAPVTLQTLELPLLSRLLSLPESEFLSLTEGGSGAGASLYKAVRASAALEELFNNVVSKNITRARARRLLLSAALNLRRDNCPEAPPYLRVLAANERGREHLKKLKAAGILPIITKPAAVRSLPEDCGDCFRQTSAARDFYTLGCPDRKKLFPGSDYRTSPFLCP